jgi:L-amino acid N-acyltransferase YncA
VELHLRPAAPDDAPAICHIYNQGIEDRAATLETLPRTTDERRQWLASRDPRHPVIVAEDDDGEVVGWGSLNAFSPRASYRFVADFSLYVERGRRGKGIGRQLLAGLVELARQHGYHKLVLSTLPWNAAGLRLYETFGFRVVGLYQEQGQLDGRWVDTVIMEKLL